MNAMSVGGTGVFLFPTSTRTAKTGARNMADEQTQPTAEAEQQPQDAAPTGAEPGNQTEQARTFSQADIDRIVTERLAKEKAKSEAAVKRAQEEAEAKRLAEQGEFQKLYEQAQARLQEAEERAKTLQIEGIKRDVAQRLNLPAAQILRPLQPRIRTQHTKMRTHNLRIPRATTRVPLQQLLNLKACRI